MRLIDADAFYKRYCEMYEDGVDDGEIDRIAYMISTEPTAYDVEKVVEQLEEQRTCSDYGTCNHCQSTWCPMELLEADEAIEIVRNGGVE